MACVPIGMPIYNRCSYKGNRLERHVTSKAHITFFPFRLAA